MKIPLRILIYAGYLLAFGLPNPASAAGPSSRPGMGSIPYADAGGTGTTFRVWAPNATSMAVKGQFSAWASI